MRDLQTSFCAHVHDSVLSNNNPHGTLVQSTRPLQCHCIAHIHSLPAYGISEKWATIRQSIDLICRFRLPHQAGIPRLPRFPLLPLMLPRFPLLLPLLPRLPQQAQLCCLRAWLSPHPRTGLHRRTHRTQGDGHPLRNQEVRDGRDRCAELPSLSSSARASADSARLRLLKGTWISSSSSSESAGFSTLDLLRNIAEIVGCCIDVGRAG